MSQTSISYRQETESSTDTQANDSREIALHGLVDGSTAVHDRQMDVVVRDDQIGARKIVLKPTTITITAEACSRAIAKSK